jgi:hypothetical protein
LMCVITLGVNSYLASQAMNGLSKASNHGL